MFQILSVDTQLHTDLCSSLYFWHWEPENYLLEAPLLAGSGLFHPMKLHGRKEEEPSNCGSGFNSFNPTEPATLVGLPTISMEYVFLEHEGTGGLWTSPWQ